MTHTCDDPHCIVSSPEFRMAAEAVASCEIERDLMFAHGAVLEDIRSSAITGLGLAHHTFPLDVAHPHADDSELGKFVEIYAQYELLITLVDRMLQDSDELLDDVTYGRQVITKDTREEVSRDT